jgi:hypothetical protein
MLSHHWGIKTFYYSLINKQGAKSQDLDAVNDFVTAAAEQVLEDIEDCESCKL